MMTLRATRVLLSASIVLDLILLVANVKQFVASGYVLNGVASGVLLVVTLYGLCVLLDGER